MNRSSVLLLAQNSLVLSFNAKRKYERKGAQKTKLTALLPASHRHMGPKAINFALFWGSPPRCY
jgi:hypothetical protein